MIEQWIRERRQRHLPVTSPVTGAKLPSAYLMPVVALQKAIEVYLAHRPELKHTHAACRSFEEAAQILRVRKRNQDCVYTPKRAGEPRRPLPALVTATRTLLLALTSTRTTATRRQIALD